MHLITHDPLADELEGWRGGVEDLHEADVSSNVHAIRTVSIGDQYVAFGTDAGVTSFFVHALTHLADV